MIERSVSLYDRGSDGIYLHPSALTEMGVLVAVPPFLHVAAADRDDRLWSVVTELLPLSGGKVAHPTQWNQLEPLILKAHCKTWNEFAKEARFCSVDLAGGSYVFTPGVWDGKGFEEIKARAREVSVDAGPSECSRALIAALGA